MNDFGQTLSNRIGNRLAERRQGEYLRLSNYGKPCSRQLWYSVNRPDRVEPLSPATRLKFLVGDIVEAVVIWLSKLAGHEVVGEQDEITVAGVVGHRDAVIDGRTVDVKSASTRSFEKFDNHGLAADDAFGYLRQLGAYVHGGKDDPRVVDKQHGSFIAFDKQHGHLCLDTYKLNADYEKIVEEKKVVVAAPEPPERDFLPQKFGESGNMKLGVECSYCPFKKTCYPGVRAFAYAKTPVFLTTVARQPKRKDGTNIPEIPI